MKIVALKTATSLAASHGLSERWLKARKNIFTSSRQVDADALDLVVYSSSKKATVLKPLAKEWNDYTARLITKNAVKSKSQSLWGKHFDATRDSSRVSVKTLGELIRLQPRSAFFTDYLEDFKNTLSLGTYSTLQATLKGTEQKVRHFLKGKVADPAARAAIVQKDYEDLYTRMLDAVNLLGQPVAAAYSKALNNARTNDSSEEGSAKEVPLYYPEHVCGEEPSMEELLSSKQTMQRLDTLYATIKMRFANSRNGAERSQIAIAIFKEAIHGATDNEIIEKLGLRCTRQRVQQIRAVVMQIAQDIFR